MDTTLRKEGYEDEDEEINQVEDRKREGRRGGREGKTTSLLEIPADRRRMEFCDGGAFIQSGTSVLPGHSYVSDRALENQAKVAKMTKSGCFSTKLFIFLIQIKTRNSMSIIHILVF